MTNIYEKMLTFAIFRTIFYRYKNDIKEEVRK